LAGNYSLTLQSERISLKQALKDLKLFWFWKKLSELILIARACVEKQNHQTRSFCTQNYWYWWMFEEYLLIFAFQSKNSQNLGFF
jgi:hypothetical protein